MLNWVRRANNQEKRHNAAIPNRRNSSVGTLTPPLYAYSANIGISPKPNAEVKINNDPAKKLCIGIAHATFCFFYCPDAIQLAI